MITQPQLEAQPATPGVQHRPHIHLPGRPHLRPVPRSTRATGTRPLNIALAGLQLLIGYEWLLAGGDKFLLGAFPAQLGGLLNTVSVVATWSASSPPSCRDSWRPMPCS